MPNSKITIINRLSLNLNSLLVHNLNMDIYHLFKFRTEKCNTLGCKICKYIYNESYIFLKNSNIKLKLCENTNCESTNIIYIIYCTKCNCLYVGETEKNLRTRINQHLNHIVNFIPHLKYTNKEVARHFRSIHHRISNDFRVCI